MSDMDGAGNKMNDGCDNLLSSQYQKWLPKADVTYGTMPVLFHMPHTSTKMSYPMGRTLDRSLADGIDIDHEANVIADYGVDSVFSRWLDAFPDYQYDALVRSVHETFPDATDEELRTATGNRHDAPCGYSLYEECVDANIPYTITFDTSRLLIDVEKLDDGTEELLVSGMGPFYTRTADGRELYKAPIASSDMTVRQAAYDGYKDTMSSLVRHIVDRHGFCIIIDLHSYSVERMPYEIHDGRRPCVCLGCNDDEKSKDIAEAVMERAGDWVDYRCDHDSVDDIDADEHPFILLNEPFAGSYVPLDLMGDERIASIMLEIRKDMYVPNYRDENSIEIENARYDDRIIEILDMALEYGMQAFGRDLRHNGGVSDSVMGEITECIVNRLASNGS